MTSTPQIIFRRGLSVVVTLALGSSAASATPPGTARPAPDASAAGPRYFVEFDPKALARLARSAPKQPSCDARLLSEKGAKGRLSSIAESELLHPTKRPSNNDWRILTSGWFHDPATWPADRYDQAFGLVFVADVAEHTTLYQIGRFSGVAVIVDMRMLAFVCSVPLRMNGADDKSRSFMTLFQRALDASGLDKFAPGLD